METKLNNNEVREIAEMQKKINSYESFILAIYFMIESGEDINCPIYCNIIDRKMQKVWRWIKEHKGNK